VSFNPNTEQAVVFCNDQRKVDEVTAEMNSRGFAALALHGDVAQQERDVVVSAFLAGAALALITTDITTDGSGCYAIVAPLVRGRS
jgi:superfamily II DNA/RNA helicase